MQFFRTRLLIPALACILALGCVDSDEAGSNPFDDNAAYQVGGETPTIPGNTEGGPDKPEPDDGGDNPPVYTGSDNVELIYLHDVSNPLHVYATQEIPILIKAIDYGNAAPAANLPISWAIIEATGPNAPGDADISNAITYTDDEGVASIEFNGNSGGGTLYTVEASAEKADAQTIEVMVNDLPLANLKVYMEYEGPIALNTVKVKVVEGDFSCSQFNPISPPIDVLGEKTVLNTESKPTFKDLPAATKYTVIATAKGPNGNLAGAGCEDGVYVEPDQVNDTTVDLYVLVLNPTGTYDLHNTFDLQGTIPGEVGEVLDALTQLFYDPGGFLIDQIKNLVKEVLGGVITNLVFDLFEDQLSALITDWVLNDSPDWIQDFFTIGQDIFQVIAQLQLTGDLKISKLMNDYYVQGEISFTGIILTWKLNCDKNAPDYEECGLYPFSLEDIDDPDFPLELLTGQWTGMITNYDQLHIDPHNIALNYGKLILFVFNNLILQELTGENNLIDAVASMIGCDGIADSLSSLGIDEQDIYDACLGAVTILVIPIESFLIGLETDSLIKLTGDATLHDDDDDLIVDRIEPGLWDGQVLIEGAAGNPFVGTWDAFREQPEEEANP